MNFGKPLKISQVYLQILLVNSHSLHFLRWWNISFDELDHSQQLIAGCDVRHFILNVEVFESAGNSKDVENGVVGVDSIVAWEDTVVSSMPDHKVHVISEIGGVGLSGLSVTMRHVDERRQWISIHNNGSTKSKIQLCELHIGGELSSLAESSEEYFGSISTDTFLLHFMLN